MVKNKENKEAGNTTNKKNVMPAEKAKKSATPKKKRETVKSVSGRVSDLEVFARNTRAASEYMMQISTKRHAEIVDDVEKFSTEQLNYNTATNGDIESLRIRVNLLTTGLAVFSAVVAIAFCGMFLTGCSTTTTIEKCHNTVSYINGQMVKCGASDKSYGYPLKNSEICPDSINYDNINCDEFFKCLKSSSKCMDDGTFGNSDIECPPCEVKN